MPISHRAAYASVLNLMSISWIVLSKNGIYKLFYNILYFVICWGVTPLCLSAMIGTWMVKSTNIAISSDLLYLTFIWLSFTFYLANFTVSFTSSTCTMLLVVFLLSLYIFDGNWKVRSRMRLWIKTFHLIICFMVTWTTVRQVPLSTDLRHSRFILNLDLFCMDIRSDFLWLFHKDIRYLLFLQQRYVVVVQQVYLVFERYNYTMYYSELAQHITFYL